MYTIYINNTLPPALAVHEIYRDIFGPPMDKPQILMAVYANTRCFRFTLKFKQYYGVPMRSKLLIIANHI